MKIMFLLQVLILLAYSYHCSFPSDIRISCSKEIIEPIM